MKITDMNGLEIEVDADRIADMLGGQLASSGNSEAFKTSISVVSIYDKDGKTMDVLADSDRGKTISAIDVCFEATHSGQTKNSTVYHSDSMEKDADSWMTPFARPLIKNHDRGEEPLGRVIAYEFRPSLLTQDRDTISVTFRVSDSDAIVKFMDGRYKTMSIGGIANNVTCGICGKHIVKDGVFKFCGHWKGESYDGVKALWHIRDVEYVEASVVNTPADNWAQVVSIKPVANKEDPASKDSADTSNSEGGTTMENQDNELLGQLDALTDGVLPAEAGTNVPPSGENKAPEGTQTDDSQARIAELEAGLADKTEKIASLEQENARMTADMESLKTVSKESETSLKMQNIKIGAMLKDVVARQVALNDHASGTIKAEGIEDHIKALMGKPVSELHASLTAQNDARIAPTAPGKLQSPALAADDTTDEPDGKDAKDADDMTLFDFEKILLGVLKKQN